MLVRQFVQTISIACTLILTVTLTGCDDKNATPNTSLTTTSNQVPTIEIKMITINHEQGTTSVPIEPQKVVVLNPATLDSMDALGIKVTAVPQTNASLPPFLQKYESQDYVNAGGLFEPNYEVLSNLQPDLIIAGGRASDAYQKLSEIAPTISLAIDNKNFLPSLNERVEQLGQIFNKQQAAEQLIDQFKQKLATVKQKATNQGTAMVILVTGGKMSGYGPGSRFGFIYDELGFVPATTFANTGIHGNVINAELLLTVDPDWLFVIDRDNAIGNTDSPSAQQLLDNPLVNKTKVWQHDRIVYLDSASIYIAGGIQTYTKLLDQVEQALDKNALEDDDDNPVFDKDEGTLSESDEVILEND